MAMFSRTLLRCSLAYRLRLRLRLQVPANVTPEAVMSGQSTVEVYLERVFAKLKINYAYETVQVESLHPNFFVSYLTLNGTWYKGETGKNKKEAEQLAARASILSLLDDPAFSTPVSKIINSKFNVDAAFREAKDLPTTRVTGKELKTTTSNRDAMLLNPIFKSSSINLVPVIPAQSG